MGPEGQPPGGFMGTIDTTATRARLRLRPTGGAALSLFLGILLGTVACVALATIGATASPATPAGASAGRVPTEAVPGLLELGREFIDAVNVADEAARRTAVKRIYAQSTLDEVPEADLVALFGRLRDDLGPLELHHSEVVFRSLHAFVKSGSGWKDLQFRVETTPPYRILQLVFLADVTEPVYLPNGGLRSAETIDWIHGYVEKLMHEDELGGKILLARGNLTLFQRSIGYLDAKRSIAVTPKTRFNLGSGNKMFTAVATMLLVEEGKFGLDDPIGSLLPTFPDANLGKRITVRRLLSHSSGLGDYWTDEFERDGRTATTLRDVEPWVYAELQTNGIHFEPGAEHRYSNSGFLLLGRIIEEATGQDYFDFVRERIYEPLTMAQTDSYLTDGSQEDLAPPLIRPTAEDAETSAIWVTGESGLRGTSAGGGFSTPPDMLRFVRALVEGKLVRKETLEEMTSPQPPSSSTADPLGGGYAYGLGFLLERSQTGVLSWGHGGFAPGVNFELRYFPAEDVTFVLFCNQDNGAFDDLKRNVEKLITGDR